MSDNPELDAAEAHCQAIEKIHEEERSAEDLHALTLWREIKRLREVNNSAQQRRAPGHNKPSEPRGH